MFVGLVPVLAEIVSGFVFVFVFTQMAAPHKWVILRPLTDTTKQHTYTYTHATYIHSETTIGTGYSRYRYKYS